MRSRILLALLLSLSLAACAPQSGGESRAAPPPGNYAYVGGADTRGKGLTIEVDPDALGNKENGDDKLALAFPFHFFACSDRIAPADLAATGSGLNVGDPIRLAQTAKPEDGVQDALNMLAHRKPGLRNLHAALFHSPQDRYLMLVEFESGAGKGALYVDVTDWAIGRLNE